MFISQEGCRDGKKAGEREKLNSPKIFVVEQKNRSTDLFFSANINPIRVFPVTSPSEGTVIKLHFHYGQPVKKDDLLLELDSPSLLREYRSAVSTYIRTRETINTSKDRWSAAQIMYKEGLISKDAYITDRNSYQEAVINNLQERYNLIIILNKASVSQTLIEQLQNSNIEAIEKILNTRLDGLDIYAPESGIVLMPTQDDKNSAPLAQGAEVRSGQSLLSIGDLSGLAFDIHISEVNLADLKVGQKAIITGPGFPEITLEGIVTQIGSQALQDSSGGLPSFPARIEVQKLENAARKKIRIGMSTKIELQINIPGQISIPLQAVTERDRRHWVHVRNPKTQAIEEREITPGTTSQDQITVPQGLKVGDELVIP